MLTTQYCYFALKTTTMSADAITSHLLVQPDDIMIMGSQRPEHDVPRYHAWKIVRKSVESVDEQIQHLIDRLAPAQARLVALVGSSDVSPVMQVVRHFTVPVRDSRSVLRRPHPVGWHLSLPVLDFLAATRTTLDVDEYDFDDEAVVAP